MCDYWYMGSTLFHLSTNLQETALTTGSAVAVVKLVFLSASRHKRRPFHNINKKYSAETIMMFNVDVLKIY